jgi:23S rRNA (guanosine2251-2'-O)-methyltransferase
LKGEVRGVAVAKNERQLVFGLHAVAALLEHAPARVLDLWIRDGRDDDKVQRLRDSADRSGIRAQPANQQTLTKLVGEVTHQGVVAAVRPSAPWTDNELLAFLDRGPANPLLLVLDGVTDPHNLGACMRSADAAGVAAVVVPKDRSAGLDSAARKVAAGAAEFLPFAAVTNLARTLDALKERQIWTVGLAGDAPKDIYSADLKGPLAIVMGGEGAGMRRLTRERCDYLVKIPMVGSVESLNVSVAAGIALFEARRQRRQ